MRGWWKGGEKERRRVEKGEEGVGESREKKKSDREGGKTERERAQANNKYSCLLTKALL